MMKTEENLTTESQINRTDSPLPDINMNLDLVVEKEIDQIVKRAYDHYTGNKLSHKCCLHGEKCEEMTRGVEYITEYKNETNYFLEMKGDEYCFHILHCLDQKIAINIKKRLEDFFDLPEFKNFKESYEKIEIENKEKADSINLHGHCHQNYCCRCYQKMKHNLHLKEEEESKVSVLADCGKVFHRLQDIYYSVIDSAMDLEQIFRVPLNIISKGKIPFKMIDLLKEEFTDLLRQNTWVKNSIHKIYNTMKLNDSISRDQKELIYFFSEIAVTGKSELTRFKLLLQNEIHKISSLRNSNLEELLSFINEEGHKSKAKKVKKKSKKEKVGNLCDFDANIPSSIYDKDVEDFKVFLLKNSIPAGNVNKIIPTFSQEWIKNMKF